MNKLLASTFFILYMISGAVFAGETVTVFAAASTTGPFLKIAKLYKEKTGKDVRFSFASSGTLVRQIEQGAQADVYVSASKKWADYASDKNLLEKGSATQLLSNSLVLICPVDYAAGKIRLEPDFDIAAAFKGKLSLGNPAHVPAGRYAKEVMDSLGWWSKLQGRMILAKDVRSALRVVEFSEAELGIVYGSDAKKSAKVKVVGVFAPTLRKPIVYIIAKCKGAKAGAAEFMKFAASAQAGAIFKEFGFIPK